MERSRSKRIISSSRHCRQLHVVHTCISAKVTISPNTLYRPGVPCCIALALVVLFCTVPLGPTLHDLPPYFKWHVYSSTLAAVCVHTIVYWLNVGRWTSALAIFGFPLHRLFFIGYDTLALEYLIHSSYIHSTFHHEKHGFYKSPCGPVASHRHNKSARGISRKRWCRVKEKQKWMQPRIYTR